MVFWILAIVVTAAACGTLYYAAVHRPVNASADTATNAHFRLQLKELEGDLAAGRLGPAEAQAARGEIAREVLRMQQEDAARGEAGGRQRRGLLVAIGATAFIAFAGYAALGQPELPAQPLAARSAPPPALELDAAVARIEAQLAETPDDLRGWSVIAPAYMQLGRFADAERAYRRVLELGPATADGQTDLGEAVMMARGGAIDEEALALFRSAAALDPEHVRSRFYLAGEATQAGRFAEAAEQWNELLALADGSETWVATAREGLAAAQAGLDGGAVAPDEEAIAGMVDGLAARLEADGGSLAEWTQLVRSRLVLGQTEEAQAAYDAAREAYPDAGARSDLDVLAADNGLVATGANK
ncbi:MAG TPA: c-type cytochrome biogenesis protein CcmI [Devosiaceae bacterium]|jgi:cytochrome c-type biogenesis protein CcmH|nr:c-type cytochrome biogenesis protein CcmI [Devosiaceae bacterium]